MKPFLTIIILLSIFSIRSNCQTKYSAPEGYNILKNSQKNPYRLDADLDNDGINDLVIVYAKNNSEDDNMVSFYLSTKRNNSRPFHSFPFNSSTYQLKMENKVVTIGGCIDTSYCRSLKFKFFPALKNLRLIGYEEKNLGSGNKENAYLKSANMIAQKFELSGPLWKKKIIEKTHFSIIMLSEINEATLQIFETMGFKYF